MDYTKCKECREWHWDFEPCMELFTVWQYDFLSVDGGYKIRAIDMSHAAEKHCAESDADGDYDVVESGGATIMVRDASGNIEVFEVLGEVVPEYTATRHDEEPEIVARAKEESDYEIYG